MCDHILALTNHIYWRQAIDIRGGWGLWSWTTSLLRQDRAATQTLPLYYHRNNLGGFYYDALWSLWTFKAMQKRFWGLLQWCHGPIRQPNVTAWCNDVFLEVLQMFLWFVRREGECERIGLYPILHRVHLHHKSDRGHIILVICQKK